MGFFEDDRIRRKNLVHNEAYELYESLKCMKYTDDYIAKYVQFARENTKDYFRNEIYSSILRIVGRSDESSTNNR